MLSGSPGHQRVVGINGYPLYLESPMSIFPQQKLLPRNFIQGGARTQVYEMRGKIIKGNIQLPLTIDANGNIDPAVQAVLNAADYPLADFTIDTNYILSQSYITADPMNLYNSPSGTINKGFDIYNRMKFESCAITNLTIKLQEEGNVTLNAEVIGTVSRTEAAIVPMPAAATLMRRNISYADCAVYLTTPPHEWDTSRSFQINIKNNIEAIYAFHVVEADKTTWTDLPTILAMGETTITGEITYALDRGTAASEKATLPTGSFIGDNLVFDLSGTLFITMPKCIAELTEQPIEMGLLQRTTKFLTLFNSTRLDANEGHFITFR